MFKPYKPSKLAMKKKVWYFKDYDIEYPDYPAYFAIGYAFNERKFLAQSEMTKFYEDEITSLEDILTKGTQKLEQINEDSRNFAVSVLMYYGIENISEDLLISGSWDFHDEPGQPRAYTERIGRYEFEKLISENLEPIKKEIKKVESFQKELSFRRQMERRGRGHWEGGGFGLAGAVKGALMAGLMNAGTSVIRGIGDSFADVNDARRVSELKNMVVNGDMPLSNFNYIVKTYLNYLWRITTEILIGKAENHEENINEYSPKIEAISQWDIDHAIGKFKNYEMAYKNGMKTKEEVVKAIIEYYAINPWDINALKALYLLNPDTLDRTEILINIVPLFCLQYEFAPIAAAIEDDELSRMDRSDSEYNLKVKTVRGHKLNLDCLVSTDQDVLSDVISSGKYTQFYIEYSNKITQNNDDPDGNNSGGGTGGCYIATAVYGSYDCPQVWTLRRFRDNTLGKTWYGRAFIRTYYAISPTLVKWFGDTQWFKNIWQKRLDLMVAKLKSEGVESTPYEDKEWNYK